MLPCFLSTPQRSGLLSRRYDPLQSGFATDATLEVPIDTGDLDGDPAREDTDVIRI